VRKSCREITQNMQINECTETRNCTNSVMALQDHCSYKAPTTNHHIKQTRRIRKVTSRHGRPQKIFHRAGNVEILFTSALNFNDKDVFPQVCIDVF